MKTHAVTKKIATQDGTIDEIALTLLLSFDLGLYK